MTSNGLRLVTLRHGDDAARAACFREVRAALETHRNVTRAAEVLGLHRTRLAVWIARTPALTEGIEMQGRGRPAQDDTEKSEES